MKKILVIGVVIILLLTGCTTGNNSEQGLNQGAEIIWGTDDIIIDTYMPVGEGRGLNIPFAYRSGRDNISLVELIGQNTDAIDMRLVDDTFETIKDLEIDGYKLGYLGGLFDFKIAKEVIIEAMKININGKIENIVFDKPLVIRPCENAGEVIELMAADTVFGEKKSQLSYVVSGLDGAIITDYGFIGAYNKGKTVTYIDKVETNLNNLVIHEDNQVKFDIECTRSDENENSTMLGNFYFKYLDNEGNEQIYYFPLAQQGIGNETDGIIALKELLGIEGK